MKPVHVKIDNKDCVIISEKLYSGLVRALSYKIDYHSKLKKLKKENKLLKDITNTFQAVKANSDNDDTLIIASECYFDKGMFTRNYFHNYELMYYLEKYDNDPKYSTNELIRDLWELCRYV